MWNIKWATTEYLLLKGKQSKVIWTQGIYLDDPYSPFTNICQSLILWSVPDKPNGKLTATYFDFTITREMFPVNWYHTT